MIRNSTPTPLAPKELLADLTLDGLARQFDRFCEINLYRAEFPETLLEELKDDDLHGGEHLAWLEAFCDARDAAESSLAEMPGSFWVCTFNNNWNETAEVHGSLEAALASVAGTFAVTPGRELGSEAFWTEVGKAYQHGPWQGVMLFEVRTDTSEIRHLAFEAMETGRIWDVDPSTSEAPAP
jgi:hypothetical protein